MMILPLIFATLITMPQAAPIDVGRDSGGRFAFDWSGQHEDGTAGASTTDAEFHYIPVAPTPPAPSSDGHWSVKLPLVAVIGENFVTMKTALVGIPSGVYDLNVRLFGVGGNPSGYSTPVLAIRVRVKNPAAPTNVRVVGG